MSSSSQFLRQRSGLGSGSDVGNGTIGVAGFCDNELFSDIRFIVGHPDKGPQRTFHGHKNIFSAKSPVFHAMFTISIPIEDATVRIPDIQPEIFDLFMDHIYQGKKLASNLAGTLKLDDLINLTYAATKYMVQDLVTLASFLIADILSKALEPESALGFWKRLAVTIPDSPVMSYCDYFIDRYAQLIIRSRKFMSLSLVDMKNYISRDTLHIMREDELFYAVFLWACNQCSQLKIPANPDNLRTVIGPALYEIRLSLIADVYTFSRNVCPKQILSLEEVHHLAYEMNANYQGRPATQPKIERPFNSRPRIFTMESLFRGIVHRTYVPFAYDAVAATDTEPTSVAGHLEYEHDRKYYLITIRVPSHIRATVSNSGMPMQEYGQQQQQLQHHWSCPHNNDSQRYQ